MLSPQARSQERWKRVRITFRYLRGGRGRKRTKKRCKTTGNLGVAWLEIRCSFGRCVGPAIRGYSQQLTTGSVLIKALPHPMACRIMKQSAGYRYHVLSAQLVANGQRQMNVLDRTRKSTYLASAWYFSPTHFEEPHCPKAIRMGYKLVTGPWVSG